MLHRFHVVLFSLTLVCFTGCGTESEDPVQSSDAAGKSANKSVNKSGAGTESKPSETKPAETKPAETKPAESKKAAATKAGRLDETTYDHFGTGVVAEGDNITIADLAAKSEDLAGKTVRLAGKVEAVCKAKGCWMILADGEKKVRVKFRDYGFFVPKDCEGREVVLEGTYSVSKTSVAELKHLLEDEGKTEEAKQVTEPMLEMKVMADGVAMKKK